MYYSQVQTVILLYALNLVVPSSSQHLSMCVANEIENLLYDPTEWIEQPIDHFNDSDPRTFTSKYYKILNYWKPDGPILLFLQGEMYLPVIISETHSKDHVNPSLRFFVHDIVEETGAAYFMVEHRYFGESQPFLYHDLTDENLRFLTARQALADIFNLLTTIKKTPEFQNSKVMVVGGSYAGNLAVWLKQMYPELIDAVLANSAPLLAKLDFDEAFETVTEAFRTYGSQECVDKIAEVFYTYHELFKSLEGIEKIKNEFNICDDDNMTVPLNQQYFFDILSQNFFVKVEKGNPDYIDTVCKGIISSELEQQQFFDKNYGPLIGLDSECFMYDLEAMINFFNEHIPDFRFPPFRSCHEFGHFVTASSSKQMFGNTIPLDYFITQCKLYFGEEFDKDRVEQGVINTNRMYGGLTPNVTNVVFVNGDMDPWHRLSIVQDLSADAPAIFIKGSSQCSIFYPDEYDSDDLKDARKRIKNLLKKWIGQA